MEARNCIKRLLKDLTTGSWGDEGIMRERTSNLGDLKYVQIHDLDDSFNNSRVHCTYDLRLQIKQRGSFVNGFK